MIICCGEALIDMLPRQLDTGDDVFLPVYGGALFNTAISLGRLGVPSGFVSGISTDMFGDQLMDSLKASNVATDWCVRKDHPTTLAFVKLVDGQAQYTFIDEASAGRMLAVADLPEMPADLAALHFGAISLIPEPCGTAFETLMSGHQEQAVISLDPNIRPGFITDAQSHRSRISRMIAMSDIVKVSDEDLEWIAGSSGADGMVQEMIARDGVSIVVLTKGAQGVEIHSANGSFEIAARKVDVADTIGAGDSFNGGFLAGLDQSGLLNKSALKRAKPEELRPAAELAVEVAAITVTRAGANPPWASDLQQ